MSNEEQLIEKVWSYSVVAAALVVIFFVLRIAIGLVLKKGNIVKGSTKYLINTVSFLFVYAVYFSFFIVVQAPHGETREESINNLYQWVKSESIEWFLWALLLTLILFLINKLYQLKVEKIRDNRQLALLALFDLAIMVYGIILGSYQAIFGLIGEIDRHTY
jgi:hypothetical protein